MELQAMIVAIYARVSTSDQSCDMQLHELRQYVAKRDWQVFAEYVDTGFSGAAASRPRLDQLLRDARLRKFEAVLVWKLDRWGRSVAHCVRSIQELVSLGVRFLSPTESIDTGADSPMSKFLLHLFAAFAENRTAFRDDPEHDRSVATLAPGQSVFKQCPRAYARNHSKSAVWLRDVPGIRYEVRGD
jgi:DNA invertase Pin-like site-specific DNA recombinase